MTPRDRPIASHTLAPTLLVVSVVAAIVAQLGAPLPLAGAVALAAWGTALAGSMSRGRVVLTLVVYIPLVALAMLAQLDAAEAAGHGRQFVAAVDSGAAAALLFLLMRRA